MAIVGGFMAELGASGGIVSAPRTSDARRRIHMRLRPFLSAALILWMGAPALAQEWKEFAFQQDRFTCNFPGDPKITDTTFMSQFGHRLPARVYSVELSPNHKYSVTVVDYSNITQLGLE